MGHHEDDHAHLGVRARDVAVGYHRVCADAVRRLRAGAGEAGAARERAIPPRGPGRIPDRRADRGAPRLCADRDSRPAGGGARGTGEEACGSPGAGKAAFFWAGTYVPASKLRGTVPPAVEGSEPSQRSGCSVRSSAAARVCPVTATRVLDAPSDELPELGPSRAGSHSSAQLDELRGKGEEVARRSHTTASGRRSVFARVTALRRPALPPKKRRSIHSVNGAAT